MISQTGEGYSEIPLLQETSRKDKLSGELADMCTYVIGWRKKDILYKFFQVKNQSKYFREK